MIGGAKGIGLGLDFGIGNQVRPRGSGSTIDTAVKEALCGVWIADQNTNDSPTRTIIKNKLSNKGGDFEILNAAYKLNSGHGKYEVDYTAYAINDRNNVYTKINHSTIIGYNTTDVAQSYAFVYTDFYHENIEEYCIVIEDLVGSISYRYIDNTGKLLILKIETNGKHLLPKSYNSLPTTNQWVGYTIAPNSSASITQIPNYKGAFVTDGVDDLIVSQKKTLEIIGENQPYTVVSMIGFIGGTQSYFNNAVGTTKMNKNRIVTNNITTGIFGYTANSVGASTKVINNILGDKNNYNSTDESATAPVDRRFSVEGYIRDGVVLNVAEIAWYWTFIANKVLTADEINQVIAYYNLDKHVTPDVYYNVKKQGITNENHSEFGDKLIDYSGNGKDMQLYNFGWKLDSGIGKYEFDFTTFRKYGDVVLTNNKIYVPKGTVINVATLSYTNMTTDVNSYTVEIKGLISGIIIYYYRESNGKENRIEIKEDGIYSLPKSYKTDTGTGSSMGFVLNNGTILDNNGMIITQLPSYEGALVTDGIEDYGQVEGLPIYTDYAVVAERAWIELANNNGSLIGKSYSNSNGAFIVEQSFDSNTDWGTTYSFGQANGVAISNIKEKEFIIQSKHKYGLEKVTDIVVGTGIDNTDIMTFATVRPKDTRFSKLALWNLMLFPYSLSEFLIERQLKKHKAGTLYEGKIEFRPKISSNIPYSKYQSLVFRNNNWVDLNIGDYVLPTENVVLRIYPHNDTDVISSITINGLQVSVSMNNDYYQTENIKLSKSPQKIDITIDEYIRFEDIVQAYPAFFTFYNTETDEIYSWGSTIKVGSTIKIKRITNLLENVYSIYGYIYDGEQHSYREIINKEFVVGKENMNFSLVKRYLVDNNEPKVVLSPERLRLSNETYKLLGYIPDLSGNKNHGVLNNFAYKDMSGADGYVEDFSAWNKYPFANVTYNKITISRNPDANWIIYTTSGHVIDPYEIKVSGIPADGEIVYKINNVNTVLVNGINKLEGATITAASGFYITKHGNTYWKDLVIEQLPKYEGSVTFDGVDDFVSIPTLYPNGGGKQLLMKLNWKTINKIIYDQRGNSDEFAIFTGTRADNSRIAYNGRNNGNTYIDGALNDSIPFTDLQNVTHNITITNPLLTGRNFSTPIIGSNIVHTNYFSDLSMYTFMLFDEISTDDNILKLNEIVGIEVKPETNN